MKKLTTVLLLLVAVASLFIFGSIVAFASAATPAKQTKSVTAQGTMQDAGITTYQYGQYALVDKSGHTLFALRSSKLDLAQFVGKSVKITGTLVSGYPVDGGPKFLDVKSVSVVHGKHTLEPQLWCGESNINDYRCHPDGWQLQER